MAIHFIEGVEAGTKTKNVVLFCSTSGAVLGKRIHGTVEDAERFLAWFASKGVSPDLRRLDPIEQFEQFECWEREGRPGV